MSHILRRLSTILRRYDIDVIAISKVESIVKVTRLGNYEFFMRTCLFAFVFIQNDRINHQIEYVKSYSAAIVDLMPLLKNSPIELRWSIFVVCQTYAIGSKKLKNLSLSVARFNAYNIYTMYRRVPVYCLAPCLRFAIRNSEQD